MNWIEKLKHARRVSVPLVAIATPDPQSTMCAVAAALNGNGTPIVAWDVCRGLTARNEAGKQVCQAVVIDGDDPTAGQPAVLLAVAHDFPANTICFMLNAPMFWDKSPAIPQGIWNLRDVFKSDGRMLIQLGTDMQLPIELQGDVVIIDEPLPDEEQLAAIIKEQDEAASVCGRCGGGGTDKGLTCSGCNGTGKSKREAMNDATLERAVEAVKGLPAFGAEQSTAMALRPTGIDLDHLWGSKIKEVEQTRGLSVYRGGEAFSDLGGLEPLKAYLKAIMNGRRKIRLIAWLDEVEKTGLGSRNDTAGVNQDQEGTLLQFLEDNDAFGIMLLGVPGTGKSAICKAVGSEFDRLVVRIDLGAMQGSYIGQSQQQLRTALKVVKSIGGNDTLWLASSNSISSLSGAMRSRFTDTFFFDLPDVHERRPIWDVWIKKLGLDDVPYRDDDGWVGRNIRQCVDKAWTMNLKIADVAKWIVPVAMTEREELEKLRTGADGKYLSAQRDGVYRKPEKAGGRRSMSV